MFVEGCLNLTVPKNLIITIKDADLIIISVTVRTDIMLASFIFDECRLEYHSHTLDYFPGGYFLILVSKNHEYLKYLTD